jgi:hypothetical protein
MSSTGVPRVATWVLTRCASHYRHESLIGDLLEQYEERGGWWYWRQTLGAVRLHAFRVLLDATKTHVPAAEFIGDLILAIALAIFGFMQFPMYAGLFIAGKPLVHIDLHLVVISATTGAVLLLAAATAHEIRARLTQAD